MGDKNLEREWKNINTSGCHLPYYPAYTTHFYTPQHLCQGGGACYQRVHKQNFFTLMLWVRGVRGSEHLSLVGSYCLLSCHHDNVIMIAILIPYMYQLMFKNRLPVLVIGITCTVTLNYKHCKPLILLSRGTAVTVQGSST